MLICKKFLLLWQKGTKFDEQILSFSQQKDGCMHYLDFSRKSFFEIQNGHKTGRSFLLTNKIINAPLWLAPSAPGDCIDEMCNRIKNIIVLSFFEQGMNEFLTAQGHIEATLFDRKKKQKKKEERIKLRDAD